MEVTALDFYKDMNTDDYFHITLTDEEDIPDAIGKLRCIYPNESGRDSERNGGSRGEIPDGAFKRVL